VAIVHDGYSVRITDAHRSAACGPELKVDVVDKVLEVDEVRDLRDALTDWLQAIGRDHRNPGDPRP
jgi:hypothetical protein